MRKERFTYFWYRILVDYIRSCDAEKQDAQAKYTRKSIKRGREDIAQAYNSNSFFFQNRPSVHQYTNNLKRNLDKKHTCTASIRSEMGTGEVPLPIFHSCQCNCSCSS